MVLRELLVTFGVRRDRGSFERANRAVEGLSRAGRKLGAILATGVVARGFKQLIQDASDAAEEANKFNAVFGKVAPEVSENIEEISKRTKSSTLELSKMASNIGALVRPALGSAAAAGKMSASVSELVLDISSFNDIPTDLALTKLRAGLIGSQEPLQSVGVDVRMTNEGIKKFAESLGKTTKELTEGEKIQARYNTIVAQLRAQGALGDATRTANEFANASRNLRGFIKELSAAIGGFLLPAVTRQVVSLRDLAQATTKWLRANRDIIQQRVDRALEFISSVLRTLGRVLGVVIDGWAAISDLLGPVGDKLLIIGGAIAALATILGLPVVALLALGAAFALVLEDIDKFMAGGKSAIGTIVDRFVELQETFDSTVEAVAQLSGQFAFHMAKMLGFGEDTAAGIGGAFAAVVRVITTIIADIGEAIGVAVGGVASVVEELMAGRFQAAARAASQAAGELGGLALEIGDQLSANLLAGGGGRASGAELIADLNRVQAAVVATGGKAIGVAGKATGAVINAVSNITIQGETAQTREFGRGVGEGIAREETRRLRQAQAAVVGGTVR